MEDHNISAPVADPPDNGCINCGSLAVLQGYPNALCHDCREKFIKYPIPLWIKLFAAGITLIFLFSLYKIPRNISLGVHFEKGKTAISQKRFMTAQKEFQEVVNKVPGNMEAQCYLLIATFHNMDFEKMSALYQKLEGKSIEDQTLYAQVNQVLTKSVDYFPNQSFGDLYHKYSDNVTKIPDTALTKFIDSNATNSFALTAYASRLFDRKDYTVCDTMLQKVLALDPDYFSAINMMTVLKREENKLDESLAYCDRALEFNKESVLTIASKARTLLKAKRDKEALELALQATKLDANNPYAMASLVMAYHFLNMSGEKEALLKKLNTVTDSSSKEMIKYAKDVISGKESFRK